MMQHYSPQHLVAKVVSKYLRIYLNTFHTGEKATLLKCEISYLWHLSLFSHSLWRMVVTFL